MSSTIKIEVGDLYAELHEQFSEELPEQYNAISRKQMEELLHNLNQLTERQKEQMGDLPDDINVEDLG